MLKYQVNVNGVRNDLIPIDFSDFTIEPIIDEVNDDESIKYSDKNLLTFYCDNELTFNKDARIIVKSERYMINDDFISSTAYSFNTVYTPVGVNKENRSFSIVIDKYFDLSVEKAEEITEDGIDWIYIHFNGSHLFDTSSGNVYQLYVTYDGTGGYNLDDPDIFYVGATVGDTDEVTDDEGVTKTIVANSEYITSSVVRIKDMDSDLKKIILNDISMVDFYRDNFIFVPDGFGLYLDKPMATLSIPFSQKFSTDLMQDEVIREQFTEVERKKAINSITEMEKDIYHPVIWNSTNDELWSNGDKNGEVYKIRFNLHFRQHRGDDWLADADSFWNGIKGKGGSLSFIDDYFSYTDKSKQSDLLSYLNFTDKDVRYQKNKLKKSFLRVMFFDSTNPTNQNMLAYYTIFMDSGAYFSKYVRYIETEEYKKVSKDPDDSGIYTVKTDLTGIKVDREPTKTSKLKTIDSNTKIDDIEAVRLSSQLVVEDKYMSNASSEGFYLYLWKDNMNGIIPTDIYMKVEFNHAGYGRTIPFMMPFLDPNKGEGNGIKSFDDIRKDWNVAESNYGTVNDTRYGIRKYLKYSYIHFKYRYDKKDNRHIYYLDDKFYGDGVHFEDNAITLNLYEAKIV